MFEMFTILVEHAELFPSTNEVEPGLIGMPIISQEYG